jgi:hypothetical protein
LWHKLTVLLYQNCNNNELFMIGGLYILMYCCVKVPQKLPYTGTQVHDHLCAELTKKALVSGIKQASPLDQTSCLEGFHFVLNHFAPKMLAYSHSGMYCRYVQYFLNHCLQSTNACSDLLKCFLTLKKSLISVLHMF